MEGGGGCTNNQLPDSVATGEECLVAYLLIFFLVMVTFVLFVFGRQIFSSLLDSFATYSGSDSLNTLLGGIR